MYSPPSLNVASQRLSKHVAASMDTDNNRRIVGGFVFCALSVISKESEDYFSQELLVDGMKLNKEIT